jgi:hypothetical protein
MKMKLLGLISVVAILGLSPANASTFTYDVGFDISGSPVTGSIVTDNDNGSLAISDFISKARSPSSRSRNFYLRADGTSSA